MNEKKGRAPDAGGTAPEGNTSTEGTPVHASLLTQHKAARNAPDLTRTRLFVLFGVGMFVDARTGRGFASVAQIAGALGISKGAVQEHISGLRADGWLVSVRRGSGSSKTASVHQLTIPTKYAQPEKAMSGKADEAKSVQPDNEDTLSSGKSGAMSAQPGLLGTPSQAPCVPSVTGTSVEGTDGHDDPPTVPADASTSGADKQGNGAAEQRGPFDVAVDIVVATFAWCEREAAAAWVREKIADRDVHSPKAYIEKILSLGDRPPQPEKHMIPAHLREPIIIDMGRPR